MNYYRNRYSVASYQPLAPLYTDILKREGTDSPISVDNLKEHLNYVGGSGQPYDDDTTNKNLTDDLEWAIDFITPWFGKPIVIESVEDYYVDICPTMVVSSNGIVEDSPPPKLEVILEGQTVYSEVSTSSYIIE